MSIVVSVGYTQITLTGSTHISSVGDNYSYVGGTPPTSNYRETGANVTWDFTTVFGNSFTSEYKTLSNSNEPNTFPFANLVEAIAGSESYYHITTNSITFEGHLTNQSRVIYTDKREFLKFPITYNDVFNETFAGTSEHLGGGGTFDRSGAIEIVADGYGDLILPYGTVPNVLRIRSVYNYGDAFMGTHVGDFIDTVYTWYHATTKSFIASVSSNYTNGALTVSNALYMANITVSSNDLAFNEPLFKFFPNPAHDNLMLKAEEHAEVNISAINGSLIKSISINNNDIQQIDISDLKAGIYILNYRCDSQFKMQRLFVN